MSLQDDLRKQARQLATKEPKRPRQASLRRAISTAYYALFHLLVSDACRFLLAGSNRRHMRESLARAFSHSDMKKVAQQFATNNVQGKVAPLLNQLSVPVPLQDVAQAFIDLQQARHEADYDISRRFTRSEALDLIDLIDQAFHDWSVTRQTPQAEAFMLSLLISGNLKI